MPRPKPASSLLGLPRYWETPGTHRQPRPEAVERLPGDVSEPFPHVCDDLTQAVKLLDQAVALPGLFGTQQLGLGPGLREDPFGLASGFFGDLVRRSLGEEQRPPHRLFGLAVLDQLGLQTSHLK